MTEQKKPDQAIAENTGIQIFEESCGRVVRVCDPAEFGITARKPTPSPKRPNVPAPRRKASSMKQQQGPIVITEESLGKTVRVVDIAEINAIVKEQFNLG